MTWRLIRMAAAALLALAILLVGGMGIVLLAFDPDAYKALLIASVQQRYHRRLELPGTLSLSLFPPFTLDAGPLRLSAADGHTPFMQADDVRLRLDPLRLLRRALVIDGVEIDRARVQLQRDAQGRWNFSDLLALPAPTGAGLALPVNTLRLADAELTLEDASTGLRGRLERLNLQIDDVGAPTWQPTRWRAHAVFDSPSLDTWLTLQGELRGAWGGAWQLRQANLRAEGSMLDARLLANLQGDLSWHAAGSPEFDAAQVQLRAQGRSRGGQPLQLQAGMPGLSWRPGAWSLGPLQARLLLGAAPSTLQVSLQTQRGTGRGADLQWPKVHARAQRAGPSPLQGSLDGAMQLRLPLQTVSVGPATLRAAWNGASGAAPDLTLSGQASYQPGAGIAAITAQGRAGAAALQLDGSQGPAQPGLQARLDRVEFGSATTDASWAQLGRALRDAPGLQLQLQVAQAILWGTRWTQAQAQMLDDGKTVHLDELRLQGYGGRAQGSLNVDLGRPGFALRQQWRQVQLGTLLQDVWGRPWLTGTADLDLQVQGTGADTPALLRALNGQAQLQVRNGRLLGVDLDRARATVGARTSTAVRSLQASCGLSAQHAECQNLTLRSAAHSFTGRGTIDLGTAALDLGLRAAGSGPALNITGTPGQPLLRLEDSVQSPK